MELWFSVAAVEQCVFPTGRVSEMSDGVWCCSDVPLSYWRLKETYLRRRKLSVIERLHKNEREAQNDGCGQGLAREHFVLILLFRELLFYHCDF